MSVGPEDRNAASLWDMLQAARAVREFAAGHSLEDYRADLLLRSAIERQIEIIGEAARRVHPEIPWRGIIAQRHVLAHEYGEIDHERVWRVATIHVPDLIAQLEPLVPAPPADDAFP